MNRKKQRRRRQVARKIRRKLQNHRRSKATNQVAQRYAEEHGVVCWDLPECPGCDQIADRWEMMALWVRRDGTLEATYMLCPQCSKLAGNPLTKYAVFSRCEDTLTLWSKSRNGKVRS
ncbi:MAG: hypothetical protein ACPGWR_33780 [Ardenticatenaceae bacterium]